MSNTVFKTLSGSGNFTVPAGVRAIRVSAVGKEFPALNPSTQCFAGRRADGLLYACGYNANGQVGDTTVLDRSSPVAVYGGHNFVEISGGYNHFLARKADGSVWAWGENTQGQLGVGNQTPRSSPTLVSGSHSFTQIVAGVYCSAALKEDGTVWTWGLNDAGQGARIDLVDRSSPVLIDVASVRKFKRLGGGGDLVIGGGGFFAGLQVDGTVWSWGLNAKGQLGDGTTSNASVPTAAIGGHSFAQIYQSKGGHMVALKSDGTAWSWGSNALGELGDGTNVAKSSPVAVIGGHTFTKLAPGFTNIGLKSAGTAWTWGGNASGQLGDGTVVGKSSPVAVIGGHVFVEVAASGTGCCALKSDGSAWSWGGNIAGELGHGNLTPKSSPVVIVGSNVYSKYTENPRQAVLSVTPGSTIPYSTVSNASYFGSFNFPIGSEILLEYQA